MRTIFPCSPNIRPVPSDLIVTVIFYRTEGVYQPVDSFTHTSCPVMGHKESAVCCQPIRQTGSRSHSWDDAVSCFCVMLSRCLVLFARLILLIVFFKVYCLCKQVIKTSLSSWLSMPLKPPGIFWWIASFLTFPPLPLFRLLVLDFVWHPCGETLCPQSVKAEQPVCGLTPGHRDTSDDGDELESTGLTTQEQKFSFHLYFELLKATKITAALTLNFRTIGRSAFGVWPTKDFLL